MGRVYVSKKEVKWGNVKSILIGVFSFLIGCALTSSAMLYWGVHSAVREPQRHDQRREIDIFLPNTVSGGRSPALAASEPTVASILRDLRVLVVIVAFDFSQLPHFEEVLSAYHDLCTAGSIVDVIVHATVPYPVTLIDLLNSRFTCPTFTITIALKPKSLRLFLVDEHRRVFYDRINDYDLFIYTEDDIRVTPTTVATYMTETKVIQLMLSKTGSKTRLQPSDFNVGVVRYEYNYPANVIMDDNTRHATQNVTRVSLRGRLFETIDDFF
jgi:hypothetical protein